MLTVLKSISLLFFLFVATVSAADLSEEVLIRQSLLATALERETADLIIRDVTVLNVFTSEWLENQDIVIKGKRIAWVGAAGTWGGKAELVGVFLPLR